MLNQELVLELESATSTLVDALELQGTDDAHEYWVCWFISGVFLPAARALAIVHLPVLDAVAAEQLVLALITLKRLLVLSKDLEADETHDLLSQAIQMLPVYQS